MFFARRGTVSTSIRMPTPLRAATSLEAQVSPAAPRSWTAPTARRAWRPEEQRVEHRDRPRAHGEDVAQDPAHAGGRALIRLDRRRVIVALDLESAEQSVADIDGPRVLAGAERDVRSLRRQRAEQLLRALVGAVLAPHRAEHRPLERVRLATHELAHAGALERRQADLAEDVQLRLRRFRPREHRGRAHVAASAPMKRSI